MDKIEMLEQAVHAQDKGTGMLPTFKRMMMSPGNIDQKMQAMFDIFEASKPYWPPMSRDGSEAPQCKKGCHYCCHLNVDVLKPEMDFIWKKVTKYLTPEQIDAVKDQARLNYDTKHRLDYERRLESRCPCPFLDKKTKSCSIYEDRPLSCRGMYSGDLASCIEGMHGSAQNMFWAAPYLICDDIMTGAALGLTLMKNELQTSQLETAILAQDDSNIEEHGR
jgi:hypothetical protein